MSTLLTRATVEDAFSIMGQFLVSKRTMGEVAVYGGSAIMLQFEWRQSTQDVDAVITSNGNHGIVQRASDEAVKRLGLPRSWLSESIAMDASKTEQAGDRLPMGMYPTYERPGLRVLAAGPAYILAMKLMAMERGTRDDRDFQDCVSLSKELNIERVEQLETLMQQYFAEEPVPFRVAARLPGIIDHLRAVPTLGNRR